MMPARSPLSLTPWVGRLLIANAVVYFLTLTVFSDASFVQWFAFSPEAVAKQPWTVVTYMFLHSGFLHLAFNSLALFFFGPAVEEHMGGPGFLRFYFLCGLGGAALSFAFAFWSSAPVVGASAAIYGVALAFAWYWPNTPVYVFPLPTPIKVKWLVLTLAVLDVVWAYYRVGNVAHLAHLGGFLFGFLYLKGETLLANRARSTREQRSEARVLVHPSAEVARQREVPKVRADREDATLREIDRVLDKISAKGMGSLTADEKRFLLEQGRARKKD
jgi:membrane associated rhomboid family serine protease